jgi:hypothetical protein
MYIQPILPARQGTASADLALIVCCTATWTKTKTLSYGKEEVTSKLSEETRYLYSVYL